MLKPKDRIFNHVLPFQLFSQRSRYEKLRTWWNITKKAENRNNVLESNRQSQAIHLCVSRSKEVEKSVVEKLRLVCFTSSRSLLKKRCYIRGVYLLRSVSTGT